VGWAAATHKRTKLVLDALQMAQWRRDRAGRTVEKGLIHHSDAGQYLSIRDTERLAQAGASVSVGSKGDRMTMRSPKR
jgi:putative transposase